MSAELKEFQEEQRRQGASLDKAVQDANAASRKRADDFLDWALRRAQPNPKFDPDWTI